MTSPVLTVRRSLAMFRSNELESQFAGNRWALAGAADASPPATTSTIVNSVRTFINSPARMPISEAGSYTGVQGIIPSRSDIGHTIYWLTTSGVDAPVPLPDFAAIHLSSESVRLRT